MKILLLALLFVAVSGAATIDRWDTTVSLRDDGTAVWNVKISYAEPVQKSDYFIVSSVKDIHVTADGRAADCAAEPLPVGTSIACKTYGQNFTYSFMASEMLSRFGGFNQFAYRFGVPIITAVYTVKVELPIGASLAQEEELQGTGRQSYEPAWNEALKISASGSDGRVIYIQWALKDPTLGETFDAGVIYKTFGYTSQIAAFLIILAIIALFMGMMYVFRKKDYRHILPVLTDAERRVVEIVMREEKPVDQRKIIKDLDYSKPKVSRIVHDLEQRGLISVQRKGRSNVISMKKTHQNEEKKEEDKKSSK
ncbi:MAG: hypothetical protein HY365_03880 [Candidatus Aenigmarchaeota archaeon]|nr:hypothetical protein [Candidatus Aenigmarchaeota archaeon]